MVVVGALHIIISHVGRERFFTTTVLGCFYTATFKVYLRDRSDLIVLVATLRSAADQIWSTDSWPTSPSTDPIRTRDTDRVALLKYRLFGHWYDSTRDCTHHTLINSNFYSRSRCCNTLQTTDQPWRHLTKRRVAKAASTVVCSELIVSLKMYSINICCGAGYSIILSVTQILTQHMPYHISLFINHIKDLCHGLAACTPFSFICLCCCDDF